MRKKLKQRKVIIMAISGLIAFVVASMLSGNEVKQPLVIVAGEIDITKTLGEQIENFNVIPVSQNESAKLGDSVVRSLEELKDARIAIALTPGSPIPKALLATKKTGGDLALETPEYRTWYRFVGGISLLPPGVAEGDLIDISVLYLDESGTGNNILSLFLSDIEIAMTNEVDIYVKVSQEQFEKLTVASQVGQFVLQLPGQKEALRCEDLSVEEREDSDCYYENYKPGKITADDVRKMLSEGAVKEIAPPVEDSIKADTPIVEPDMNGNEESVFDEEETEEVVGSENSESVEQQVEERKQKDALVQDFLRN